jgi:hypothetical protein
MAMGLLVQHLGPERPTADHAAMQSPQPASVTGIGGIQMPYHFG